MTNRNYFFQQKRTTENVYASKSFYHTILYLILHEYGTLYNFFSAHQRYALTLWICVYWQMFYCMVKLCFQWTQRCLRKIMHSIPKQRKTPMDAQKVSTSCTVHKATDKMAKGSKKPQMVYGPLSCRTSTFQLRSKISAAGSRCRHILELWMKIHYLMSYLFLVDTFIQNHFKTLFD